VIVRLTEIYESGRGHSAPAYSFRDIFINPEHVVCLREDEKYKILLMENKLGELSKNQTFTKVYMNRGQSGIDVIVVGEPSHIQEKLGLATKQLLRG
tara:strand:- start:206 stop:496 length:291 start_codon:yes stop_codon:yes gene_type:complete